jgi:hypothetical protein
MKEGRGKVILSLPPSLPFILLPFLPANFWKMTRSEVPSNSHVSRAENADTTYKFRILKPFYSK